MSKVRFIFIIEVIPQRINSIILDNSRIKFARDKKLLNTCYSKPSFFVEKRKKKMAKIYWVYDYHLAQVCDKGNQKLLTLVDQIDYLQLRCKDETIRQSWVNKLIPFIRNKKAKIIINDDVCLAQEVNAHGVHLGNDDWVYEKARGVLGREKIIGLTVRDLPTLAKVQKWGVNYLGVGTVFETTTKRGLKARGLAFIKRVKALCCIEFFPIGGINSSNVEQLANLGIKNIAVASSLFAEDFEEELKRIREILK